MSRTAALPAWIACFIIIAAVPAASAQPADKGGGPPDKPAPLLSFSADQSTYEPGETALLSWSSLNVKSCNASGDWSGKMPVEGTYRTPPLDGPKSYTLKCNAQGGSVEETVSVEVASPATTPEPEPEPEPAPLPAITFAAADASLQSGESTTLTWSVEQASECTASGSWSGSRALSGSETIAPTADASYTLACSGDGGTDSATVAVTVSQPEPEPEPAPEPELSFTAADSTVESGGTTTLAWTATGVDGCSASGGWSGSKPVSGSEAVGPIYAGTSFSLSCNGGGGTTMQTLAVDVIGSVSLDWSPPTQNVDGTALTDLAGYRIYYGNASGDYPHSLELIDPSATSFTLTLASGTYYVAMTALDTEGNESAHSNEVVKEVR